MSDRIANKRLFTVLQRSVAGFVLVFALAVFLAPQSASALDETPSQNGASTALPTTCTALPGIAAPVPPTEPTEPGTETPPEQTPGQGSETPAAPAWSALQLSAAQVTNNMNLNWTWATLVPTNPESTYRGYGFALYTGETLLANGELGPEAVSYAYAAPANGSYRLFVWILDTTTDPATPVATGCEYRDTTYDSAAPVITVIGKGFTDTANTATPTLETTETDLTYSWTVNAGAGVVTISNVGELNPVFTFLRDGSYIFTLVATDSLGNTTTFTLPLNYTEPFIPTPEAPLPPIAPLPVDPYVPPATVLAEAKRTVSVGASYEAAVGTDVMTDDSRASSSGIASTNTDDPSATVAAATAQAVQPSNQGWVILGVPWYWWLLGIAIIGSAIQWYRSGAFRKTPDDV